MVTSFKLLVVLPLNNVEESGRLAKASVSAVSFGATYFLEASSVAFWMILVLAEVVRVEVGLVSPTVLIATRVQLAAESSFVF